MASKNNIPVPPPLKIHGGELVANWRRFKALWLNYELATDIAEESKQKRAAIFLSCIGPDAYDVFTSMALENEARADIEEVIKAFDEYCIGEINPTYERYVFNKRNQDASESFDSFVSELRRLAKSCDYGQLEECILMDRIVIGIRDDATRRKLLQTRRLNLALAIDICRAAETASRHLKEMTSADHSVQKLDQRRRSPSDTRRQRQRSDEGRGDNRGSRPESRDWKSDTSRTCKFCGRSHEFKKGLCPAVGKTCSQCSGKNHFAIVCKSKPSRYRQSCNALDDEFDAEDIFAVDNSGTRKSKLHANLMIGGSH